MKDLIKTYKLKIYLEGKRKPIIIETDKERYIDTFCEDLETKDIIKIGPVIFSIRDFRFATFD